MEIYIEKLSLSKPVNNNAEFNAKLTKILSEFKKLPNLSYKLGSKEREENIEGKELTIQDIEDISYQLYLSGLTLCSDHLHLMKKKKNSNKNGKVKGFGLPILINDKQINFFESCKSKFGKIDINKINQTIKNNTIKESKIDITNEMIDKYLLTDCDHLDGKYLIDCLSFSKKDTKGISNSTIIKSLYHIYIYMNNLENLAEPPKDTKKYLQEQYILKSFKKTSYYKKLDKEEQKKVNIDNYKKYLDDNVEAKALLNIAKNINKTDSWKNKTYIGADNNMIKLLGKETFEYLKTRDEFLSSKDELRNKIKTPISSEKYFQYNKIPQINVFNRIKDIPDNLSVYFDKDTKEYQDIQKVLNFESNLVSSFYEYIKDGERKPKRVKKRIDQIKIDFN